MYNFFLYTGKSKDWKVTGGYDVEGLLETLPGKKISRSSLIIGFLQYFYLLYSRRMVTTWQQQPWEMTRQNSFYCQLKKSWGRPGEAVIRTIPMLTARSQ